MVLCKAGIVPASLGERAATRGFFGRRDSLAKWAIRTQHGANVAEWGERVPAVPESRRCLSPIAVVPNCCPALKQRDASAQVSVTTWETKDLDLAALERSAQERVRTFKPDLVVIAVPRAAVPAD